MFYKDVIDDEFVRRMMNYKLSNMIRAEKNDTLYRYRSMESAFIKDEMENLLIHKKVFFPSRRSLNDPLDALPFLEKGIRFKEFRKEILPIMAHIRTNKLKYAIECGEIPKNRYKILAKKIRKPTAEEVREYYDTGYERDIISEGVDQILIWCLTANQNNDVMWSMYANRGNGICIGYRGWSHPDTSNTSEHPIKVRYSPNRFVMNFYKALTFFAFREPQFLVGLPKRYRRVIEDNMDGVLYGYDKLDLWSYEQEYRLTLLGAGEGYHELPHITIPEIFIGHAVSDENRHWLINYVRENTPSTICYRGKLSSDRYGYEFTEL